MFDAIAGRYDLLNRVLSVGFDRHWRARAINALELSGRETVLDLCTGTADLALAAIRGAERAQRVIGIDLAGAMLLVGKAKIHSAGLCGSIALVRGDATLLPLKDGSVDAVTIGFGIRNVEQPAVACREIARVLRRNGKLVILEFSLPRTAVVRDFYLWYFRYVLPRIGRVVSRHPSAYTYLPESVEAFPSPDTFVAQLRATGFSSVKAFPLTFGIVYMFVAIKGDGSPSA